jgi:hypothetical protein
LVVINVIVRIAVRAADVTESSALATALLILRVLIAVADDAAGLGWSAVLLGVLHERNTVTGGPIIQLIGSGIEVLSVALLILVGVLEHGNERGIDHTSPTVANNGREGVEAIVRAGSTEGVGSAGKVGTLRT